MKEKTQSEKIAANRQVQLLTTALEQAKANGGVWLNADRKLKPMLHRKEVGVSGFNSLILATASDQRHYETNLFTFYSDARRLNSPVRDGERGVPFNWYNWNNYVNKNNPQDIISRQSYMSLPENERADYKGVRQREIRWLFNVQQTILPQVERERYDKLVAKCGSAEERKAPSYENDKPLRIAVNDFQLKMRDNLVDIRHDGIRQTSYDIDKNVIQLSGQSTFADYPHFVQELMRNVAAATGHPQRLAREGMVGEFDHLHSSVSDYAVRQEKLVQELVSGIKMQELGLQAMISKDNLNMVDSWIQELKENPKFIDMVERDVNNAVDMIRRAERGEKIELASKVNEAQTEKYQLQASAQFYVADEIKMHPDKDEKLFVVVTDSKNKIADVILPQNVSLEQGNEAAGMNKGRIERALKQQGMENVRFFNPEGAVGYRPDDAYFDGKDVSVRKLKNYELQTVEKINVGQSIAGPVQMEFDRVQMIQDDANRWMLFVKPEGKEAVTIYPDKADINRFFTALKQSQENIDSMRLELANKYYAMAEAKPDLKVDIFGKNQTPEVDMNRIQKVYMFKSKSDVILCAATIEGAGKLEPRVVSPQQWQRMWLAEDRDAYKKNLAAKLYADVLQRDRSAEVVKENNPEVKQAAEQRPESTKEEKVKEDKRPKIPWTWDDLKKRHPDAMLMFRQGDLYTLFRQDAIKGGEILGITVDKIRDNVDRAWFPHHCLDTYLPKLIRSGCRVAICDELKQPVKEKEDNKLSKSVETQKTTGKEMASDKEESKIDNASIYRRVNGDFMVKAYVGADSLGSKLMSQEDKRAYLKMTNDVDKHTFAMSVANKMFKNEVANDVKRQKTHSMKM